MQPIIKSWRWFGPTDPVPLSFIRQAGVTDIVTALHSIANGQVWPVAAIAALSRTVRDAGMCWSVVESVPVSEAIKTRSGDYLSHIENYKQTIINLAQCGIHTVTYNFMPVLDWTRTDLHYPLPDGSSTLRYDSVASSAFDLYILRRPGAEADYTSSAIACAKAYYDSMSDSDRQILTRNILAGLPGSEASFSLTEFRSVLSLYDSIDSDCLRCNLVLFLESVIPTAERCGVRLVIHPDDPPFPLFGLPRIMSTGDDYAYLVSRIPSWSNGLCLCTGSWGVLCDNDLVDLCYRFGSRLGFIHMRNIVRSGLSFHESGHIEGDIDMVGVMRGVIASSSLQGCSLPIRADHGQLLSGEVCGLGSFGYSYLGRLRGLGELRGMEAALLGCAQQS
ncbi:MAG: mannonate dehydratase [Mucinivorans sp.]